MSRPFSEITLFAGISTPDVQSLQKAVITRRAKKHEVIFRKNDPIEYLYLVESGRMKLYNFRKGSEKEETVCIIGAGGYFCLAPLLTQSNFHIHAKALEDSELVLIPKKIILELVERSHTFSKNIIRALAGKECELCEEVCDLSLSTTKERLAKYLLGLFDPNKKNIPLSLNQSELASHLGTVRETLSRDLAGFKKSGIISMKNQKISILKADELAFISGQKKPSGMLLIS